MSWSKLCISSLLSNLSMTRLTVDVRTFATLRAKLGKLWAPFVSSLFSEQMENLSCVSCECPGLGKWNALFGKLVDMGRLNFFSPSPKYVGHCSIDETHREHSAFVVSLNFVAVWNVWPCQLFLNSQKFIYVAASRYFFFNEKKNSRLCSLWLQGSEQMTHQKKNLYFRESMQSQSSHSAPTTYVEVSGDSNHNRALGFTRMFLQVYTFSDSVCETILSSRFGSELSTTKSEAIWLSLFRTETVESFRFWES